MLCIALRDVAKRVQWLTTTACYASWSLGLIENGSDWLLLFAGVGGLLFEFPGLLNGSAGTGVFPLSSVELSFFGSDGGLANGSPVLFVGGILFVEFLLVAGSLLDGFPNGSLFGTGGPKGSLLDFGVVALESSVGGVASVPLAAFGFPISGPESFFEPFMGTGGSSFIGVDELFCFEGDPSSEFVFNSSIAFFPSSVDNSGD